MALSVEMVAEEALGLPASGRVLLVEKLLASLAGEANPDVERAHLDEVRKRRAAVRSGKAGLVDGAEGLRKVRVAVRKELAKHGHDAATALLKQYQREIAADWIAAYHNYVSTAP